MRGLFLILVLLPVPALADVHIGGCFVSDCLKSAPGVPSRVYRGWTDPSLRPPLSFPAGVLDGSKEKTFVLGEPPQEQSFGIDLSGMDVPLFVGRVFPGPFPSAIPLVDPGPLPGSFGNGAFMHLGPPDFFLRLGDMAWEGVFLGEFGGRLIRVTASGGIEDQRVPIFVTGLAPDPESADCLLISSGLRHMGNGSGGVYRLCPSESEELTRLPGLIDESGGEIPVIALSGDGRQVWALSAARLWTLTGKTWTSQPLAMGQVPAGQVVTLPGFRLWRNAAGDITAQPSP